jgi:hypothetical protein
MVKGTKFIWIAILLIICFSQISKAEIAINPLEKSEFNLGEDINIQGFVKLDQSTTGLFEIQLICDNKENDLFIRTHNFEKNELTEFNENIFLTDQGNCYIKVQINNENTIIESQETPQFLISNSLKTKIILENPKVQLGQPITLTGTVTKQNSEPVTGSTTVQISKESKTYLTKQEKITNGQISISLDTKFLPSGTYALEVNCQDSQGNTKTEEFEVEVENEILLQTSIDKNQALPEETITISGNAAHKLNKVSEEFNIKIKVDSEIVYHNQFKDQFSHTITISPNTEAKPITYIIIVSDEYGNEGKETHTINIKQKPTKIETQINSKALQPKQDLIINSKLLDQTNQQIDQPLLITIAGRDFFLEEVIPPNKEFKLTIPEYETPKELEVSATYDQIINKQTIEILELKNITTSLNGSILTVTNTGNVEFKEKVGILLIGNKEINLSKKISLAPGEKTEFNLAKKADSDNYSIKVGNEIYKDIELRNPSEFPTKFAYLVVLCIMIIIFGVISILQSKSQKPKKQNKKKQHK